jgi:hypothetical protein
MVDGLASWELESKLESRNGACGSRWRSNKEDEEDEKKEANEDDPAWFICFSKGGSRRVSAKSREKCQHNGCYVFLKSRSGFKESTNQG